MMRDGGKVSQEEERQVEKVHQKWRWRVEKRGSAGDCQKMGWREKSIKGSNM